MVMCIKIEGVAPRASRVRAAAGPSPRGARGAQLWRLGSASRSGARCVRCDVCARVPGHERATGSAAQLGSAAHKKVYIACKSETV